MSFIRGSRYRTVLRHAGQLGVFLLGNLDAIPLPQFHHDVEEVHAVQFELLAERHVLFQIAEVFVRRDVGEDVEDGFSDFGRPSWLLLRM